MKLRMQKKQKQFIKFWPLLNALLVILIANLIAVNAHANVATTLVETLLRSGSLRSIGERSVAESLQKIDPRGETALVRVAEQFHQPHVTVNEMSRMARGGYNGKLHRSMYIHLGADPGVGFSRRFGRFAESASGELDDNLSQIIVELSEPFLRGQPVRTNIVVWVKGLVHDGRFRHLNQKMPEQFRDLINARMANETGVPFALSLASRRMSVDSVGLYVSSELSPEAFTHLLNILIRPENLR